jgi:NADPH:quinone reductase-like Zn-dependent oxidoreductase
MMRTMRRWEMDGIGRDRLALRERPIPVPGPHEVLVAVGAVALNHRDKMVIESGRGLPLSFPFTPGSDLAGRIVATGQGAERFATGDRVISCFTPEWIDGLRAGNARTPGYRTLGGFFAGVLADYVVVPDHWLVAAPTTLDNAHASTFPCAALTAWFALVERGQIRAGDTVLIRGTGGVALFAKMHGAMAILSCSPEKSDRARTLGADHIIDRHREDGLDVLYALTGDHGADHILETVGGTHLGLSVQAAAVGGRIYQIGALDSFNLSSPAMPLMMKDVTIHGIATGHRRALEDMVRAVERVGMKPVIDSRFPLSGLPDALDRLDQGPFGKIVIDMSGRANQDGSI